MIPQNEHTSEDQLGWFINQSLPEEEQAAVEAHLANCSACRARASEQRDLRQMMLEVSAGTPEVSADLFYQIELRLDYPTPWSRISDLFQFCRLALNICAEHFCSQARLVRRELFWLPLLTLPMAAMVVYLPQSLTPGSVALLVALLTALGMAFLYGDSAQEVTLVTPTSPRLVLAVRCGLVFGFMLLLNCGLVLPFLAIQGIVTPAWFLTNWLAPLCCLSALALLLSILLSANASVLICLLLWGLRLLDRMQPLLFGRELEIPWARNYESFWHQGPLLFGFAALAVLLAFIVLERKVVR